ncbi:T9SS type A sorting domain-containing protein [Kordia sp.]|uniref:T9SS type A sorting domain-containing protein n=1 Tax=Kordia sp. TaxID=1965332 RepID=UPI003B5A1AFA
MYSRNPVNDDCENAIVINALENVATYFTANVVGASLSQNGTCEDPDIQYRDVWYEFTMPIDGNIFVRIYNSNNHYITLYETDCSGTEIACQTSDTNYFYNLTMGTTYKMKYSKIATNLGLTTMYLRAFKPITNDECADAELLSLESSIPTQVSSNAIFGNESLTTSSCEDVGNTYNDVWYKFIMPINGSLHIKAANSVFAGAYFTLYDNCSSAEIGCEDIKYGSSVFFYDLIAGAEYTLRHSIRSNVLTNDSFSIGAFEVATNDECTTAESIIVSENTETTINFDLRRATYSQIPTPIPNSTEHDLWYEFTMPVDGNLYFNRTLDPGSFLILKTLYDSSCTGDALQYSASRYLRDLTAGTTYLLKLSMSTRRIFTDDQISIQPFGFPNNIDCANSESIPLSLTESTIVDVDTRTGFAATQGNNCTSVSNGYHDLWYNFTMPYDGKVRLFVDDNKTSGHYFTLYNGCSGNEVACGGINPNFDNLTAGTNYTLRYTNNESHLSGYHDGNFSIQAFEYVSNDNYTNPEPIQIVDFGQCSTQTITANFNSMRPSNPPGNGCFPNPGYSEHYKDAWYEFTPTFTGVVNIRNTSLGISNRFSVHSTNINSALECFEEQGNISVTSGNTYLLRVGKVITNDELIETNDIATFCVQAFPTIEISNGVVNNCETNPVVTISSANGNTNTWVSLYDASGDIVADINANGNELGEVSSTLFVDGDDTRTAETIGYTLHYLRRDITIVTELAPVIPIGVRLYVKSDEVNDVMSTVNPFDPSVAFPGVNELKIMQVVNNNCDPSGYTLSSGNFINDPIHQYYGYDSIYETEMTESSTFYFSFVDIDNVLSVDDLETDKLELSVYPTFSDGIINIKAKRNLGASKVAVFDMHGREVFSKKMILSTTPNSLQLDRLAKGVYFLKVQNENAVHTQKIILK